MTRRLTDLEPRWVLPSGWAAQADPFYIGVSFLCPCEKCAAKACPTCGHQPEARRLVAKFWPPIDQHNVMGRYEWNSEEMKRHMVGESHARAAGESFDTLTVVPSIGFESIGHWHGNITNGEVTP